MSKFVLSKFVLGPAGPSGCSFTRLLTRQLLAGARLTFNDSELQVIQMKNLG